MIRQLTIRNLALVDRLEVEFGPGLNLLTGETGSGKSIIVDALGLALGERATADQVRTGAESGMVEAVFEVDSATAPGLARLGIEPDEGILRLTREIARGGRATCRVDGRIVGVSGLREAGDLLVDVHGQREHQNLLEEDRLLETLDRYAGENAQTARGRVESLHQQWQELRRRLAEIRSGDEGRRRELELLAFQVSEIDAAQLQAGEDVALAEERSVLGNAERLRDAAEELVAVLAGEGDTPGVSDLLARAQARLAAAAGLDPRLEALAAQLGPLSNELDEVRRGAVDYADSIQADPARLQAVEERLDLLDRLKKRYGGDLDAAIEFGTSARRRLEADGAAFDVAGAERELQSLEGDLRAVATHLSEVRAAAARRLEAATQAELADLNMERATVRVLLQRQSDPAGLAVEGETVGCRSSGIDRVSIALSANPGEPPMPLQKVGSGGEVSRVMLALRTVLAGADQIPTIVLDEIDVGIGGRTGASLGRKLRAIGRDRQVLCVTHLASVAAMADHHVVVTKGLRQDRHVVEAVPVTGEDRVTEITRLLAGDGGGDAAREAARSMLSDAEVGAPR